MTREVLHYCGATVIWKREPGIAGEGPGYMLLWCPLCHRFIYDLWALTPKGPYVGLTVKPPEPC